MDRFQRADAVFEAALELSADERATFIDGACGDDVELRAEVLSLLRAYHESDRFLESPAVQVAAPILASVVDPTVHPDRLGPFRVVREIGRGGMGRIYLGERDDGQFEQRVALKLIQHAAPGMVRRFATERRILARWNTPASRG
jgi:eukaryotic-like serine/threonine-protein kinase